MQRKWQMIPPPAYLQAFWCLPGCDISFKNRVVLEEIKANSWNQLQLVYVNKGDRSEQKQEAHLVNNCKKEFQAFHGKRMLCVCSVSSGSNSWSLSCLRVSRYFGKQSCLFIFIQWALNSEQLNPTSISSKDTEKKKKWERGRAPLSVFMHGMAMSKSCFAQEFPRGYTTPLGQCLGQMKIVGSGIWRELQWSGLLHLSPSTVCSQCLCTLVKWA